MANTASAVVSAMTTRAALLYLGRRESSWAGGGGGGGTYIDDRLPRARTSNGAEAERRTYVKPRTVARVPDSDGDLGAPDARARARAAAQLGHRGRWPKNTAAALTQHAARDPSAAVRNAALAALVRRARPARALAAWLPAAAGRETVSA